MGGAEADAQHDVPSDRHLTMLSLRKTEVPMSLPGDIGSRGA